MATPKHWRMMGTSRFDGPGSYGTSMAKTRLAKRMRANPTTMEIEVGALVAKTTRLKAHRQVIVYGYIADVYIPAAGLVVEADGPLHQGQVDEDAIRDLNLRRRDIETIRFTPDHLRMPELCIAALDLLIKSRVARAKGIPPTSIDRRRC